MLGAVAMFMVLCGAYAFSVGLRASYGAAITADEPFYLLTTQSLLQDGDLDLTQQYERESWRSFFDHPQGLWKQSIPNEDGVLLSPHEPGTSIVVLPGFAVGGLRGAHIELLLIAALTFSLAYVFTASETGRPAVSWLLTAAVALSATPFVYATEIYPEVPAALCIVLSLLLLRSGMRDIVKALLLALLVTALAWFGAKYVLLGGVIGLYYLWQASWGARGAFVGLCALSGGFYVWWHLAVFGHYTAYSVNSVYLGASTVAVLEDHFAVQDRFYRLWGLFIDRRFGVGRWAPLLLLLLPSLPLLLRGAPLRRLVLALIGAQVLIATFLAITMMGYWFPGRTLMSVLPLAPLPLTLLVLRFDWRGRAVVALLAAYSLLITALLVQGTWALEVTLASNPFELRAWPFREAGRLFPQYTAWTAETWALNVAWLVMGGCVFVALYRRDVVAVVRRLRAGGRRASSAGRPRATAPLDSSPFDELRTALRSD